jgi:hypothetical protein
MATLVRRLRDEAGLPATFTLDASRHGGMTELAEAELTDGQGRALSAHKSCAYEGYAKRNIDRALAATRKRHAHRIAASSNVQRTEFRNDEKEPKRDRFQISVNPKRNWLMRQYSSNRSPRPIPC